MATGNFMRMKYNMPLICGGFASDADYDIDVEYEYIYAKELADNFTESLKFHDVTIENGYYDGFQFWIEERYTDYFDLDESSRYCIDEEDSDYYFEMSKAEVLKASAAEKKRIAKWLESLTEYGFENLQIVAAFSNRETFYSKVTV